MRARRHRLLYRRRSDPWNQGAPLFSSRRAAHALKITSTCFHCGAYHMRTVGRGSSAWRRYDYASSLGYRRRHPRRC
jgi:hypothetical protein